MAGIFFEVFLLISLMAIVITVFGFWKQKLIVLPIAIILFILGGGLLLSQGLQYETGATYDSVTGTIVYSFSTLTAAVDASVLFVGLAFVGIGLVLSIMFLKLYVSGGEQ